MDDDDDGKEIRTIEDIGKKPRRKPQATKSLLYFLKKGSFAQKFQFFVFIFSLNFVRASFFIFAVFILIFYFVV